MATGWPMKTTYANGDVYSASDVNDITGTINLLTSTTLSSQAGKNFVINGGFDIWQRGTSFSPSSNATAYNADRFWGGRIAFQTGITISQQTSGAIANTTYFNRIQRNNGNTATEGFFFGQNIENLNTRPLRNQTVTLSFYLKAGANFSGGTVKASLQQNTSSDGAYFSTAGWGTDLAANTITPTTSWVRYTVTATIGSSAIGACCLFAWTPSGTAGAADFVDISNVQLELGSTATTFSRAGGTIQGELAACQRYYWRNTSPGLANTRHSLFAPAASTTAIYFQIQNPVPMRVTPTAVDYSALVAYDNVGIGNTVTPTIDANANSFYTTVTATGTGLTQYRSYCILGNSGTSSLGLSAEL
jgi:hypothetical protein